MIEHELKITFCTAPLSEWEKPYQLLYEEAVAAASKAYAPYSHFQVGAAVLLANGEMVSASNQENAAYPSGLCAERVALFYAGAKYPEVAVTAIAIVAFSNGKIVEGISPCGGCRQVMLETEKRAGAPVKVFLCGSTSMLLINCASDLLPICFDGCDL
ncbi:MAG: cytidine deaminase [Massilibacteroides sp.]|nr:cytidine deaminase [Massilibacteroides sp.]MDD3061678.1 cytidine deaminase [Massilibacteroides sp.]MDD4114404.1 cytidine deaminase [Massilibacteroides sp.]MDD4660277.1 cytidine deaminase [Massilibacteroides sp.]